MIQLKSSREIELMSQGGKILGQTVRKLAEAVRPGMSTADLDAVADQGDSDNPGNHVLCMPVLPRTHDEKTETFV